MAAEPDPIRIYVDEYAEGQVMSHVARHVIESEYDIPVELKMVAVGPAFLGVANDERSLFLVAWLPRTHGAYMDRVGDKVDNLGELFDGARLGWAVRRRLKWRWRPRRPLEARPQEAAAPPPPFWAIRL